MTSLSKWAALAIMGAMFAGCGEDGGGGSPAELGGAGGADMTLGGQGGTGGVPPGPDGTLQTGDFPRDGLWYTLVNLTEVSNLRLPFQLDIDGDQVSSVLRTITIRAVNSDDGTVSADLKTLTDVPVAADGSFTASFEGVILPAAYSPSGSDIEVTVAFSTTSRGSDFMCGDLTGAVPLLEITLLASTFAAVPWGTESDMPLASCDGDEPAVFEHLTPELCPMLAPGVVDAFPSAGLMRQFRVYVPSNWDAATLYPLVFLWHGLGQSIDKIEENSALTTYVDDQQILLVVPESRALPLEWEQPVGGENADLVFFDDMVTCMTAQFGADPNRIHSTGLSAGGLWTTYLTLFRAETIASSVAFSGGLLTPYRAPEVFRPFLISWGGPMDTAFEQNFETLANELIDDMVPAGHFVVACNHGQEHKWLPEFTPFALKFLLDHPKGITPEPYAAGLPAELPAFCEIAVPSSIP